MTIKSTMTERTEPARAGSVQRLVRRWYYVEGETGVGYAGGKAHGIYTSVSQAVDSLRDAKRLMAEWQKSRSDLFWARVVRIDEARTVMTTKAPADGTLRAMKTIVNKFTPPGYTKRKSPNDGLQRPPSND